MASPDFARRAAPPEAARFCKLTLHRAKARKCQTILKTALSRIKVLTHHRFTVLKRLCNLHKPPTKMIPNFPVLHNE